MKKPHHSMQRSASRTQQERCYAVAKKLFGTFDLNPALLDVFSKKQKQYLFEIIWDSPVVRAEKVKTIPRRFLDEIRDKLVTYMNIKKFGKQENALTLTELVTYGLGFMMSFSMYQNKEWVGATPQQIDAAQQISKKIPKIEYFFVGIGAIPIANFMQYLTKCYSQVNFRLYGYKFSWEQAGLSMRMKIEMTSQYCETKLFTHKGVKRKAFHVVYTEEGFSNPGGAKVPKNKIFHRAKESEYFNLYIQSHALHRFKERVDIYDATDRNYLLQQSLTCWQHITVTDKQTFLACTCDDCPLGYFTFFVQDDDMVLNTFIPLVNATTPEGKKLHELLPFGKEDTTYLGMDKLSFYTDIDFEQIPILKQVLIDTGIWKSKLAIETTRLTDESLIDEKKTQLVKRFFDKIVEA